MGLESLRCCGARSTSRLVYTLPRSSKAGSIQLVLQDHVRSPGTYHTRRSISSTSKTARPPTSTLTAQPSITPSSIQPPPIQAAPTPTNPPTSPLGQLPFSSVLRTYAITSLSSSPLLLAGTTSLLLRMLDSRSLIFSIHRNVLLRRLLKKTFYAQFCAGENAGEVREFVKRMERVGYSGVALEYASEVLEDEEEKGSVEEGIERWERGILDSIEMSKEGSFVAFKYSGMGPSALRLLKSNSPPTPRMSAALTHICHAALARSIRVSPAAEPQNAQRAVNDWTLELARKYNRLQPSATKSESSAPPALIYNTYQTYLRSAPRTLLSDLHLAEREGFTLGVKLVRGAYLATEQRDLIHDSKEDTDDAYDGLAASLLKGRYEGPLAFEDAKGKSEGGRSGEVRGMKRVDVLLASHNMRTVERALAVRAERLGAAAAAAAEKAERGSMASEANTAMSHHPPIGDLSFAQLQGMADEVSCALLAAQSTPSSPTSTSTSSTPSTPTSPSLHSSQPQHQTYTRGPAPHVYKYCNWGTLPETLAYLLRRAAENGDAASRTSGTARAMRGEMGRRLRVGVGLRG